MYLCNSEDKTIKACFKKHFIIYIFLCDKESATNQDLLFDTMFKLYTDILSDINCYYSLLDGERLDL